MARKRSSRKSKKAAQPNVSQQQQQQRSLVRLTKQLRLNAVPSVAHTREWARIIRDPCHAPLPGGAYPGANGSILTRFSTPIAATHPNSQFDAGYFAPGLVAPNTGSGLGLVTGVGQPLNAGGVIPGDPVASASYFFCNPAVTSGAYNANQPGYDFLVNNASMCRSVAACVRVTYFGSEQARSGQVVVGQSTLREIANVEIPFNQLVRLAYYKTRTPDGAVEFRLTPTMESAEWCVPGDAVDQSKFTSFADTPVIFWATNSVQRADIQVEYVNVVEWLPKRTSGIAIEPQSTSHVYTSLLPQVLRMLGSSLSGWAWGQIKDNLSIGTPTPRLRLGWPDEL